MLRHRQLNTKLPEAGGQLFGTVSNEIIRIVTATGPYISDERTRFCYRSNPNIAQRMIETQSQLGLPYLGEWHTHAEDIPTPSFYDINAMKTLLTRSKLNTTAILLLIIGRNTPPAGINITSFDQNGWINWSPDYFYDK